MTDKQIIINGVDVSGCAERSMCINCETVTNCYYKQLKRAKNQIVELNKMVEAKKQECEGLRYEIGSLENDRDILQEQLDQLKTENKHLNDLLNQALKELEAIQDAYEERE